jgi:hypothetical protein
MQSSAAVLCTRLCVCIRGRTPADAQLCCCCLPIVLCRFQPCNALRHMCLCACTAPPCTPAPLAATRLWTCAHAHCCVAAVRVPVACAGFNPSTACTLFFSLRAQHRLTCMRRGRLCGPLGAQRAPPRAPLPVTHASHQGATVTACLICNYKNHPNSYPCRPKQRASKLLHVARKRGRTP